MKKVYIITIGCIILTLIGIILGMYFSYNNQEKVLRNQSDAQIGKIEGVYDKMWKVIQQKASVTDQYKNAFKEIYPELISGRYGNDGDSFMKWIQEDNPNFDVSLYKDLMSSIEVLRAEFQHSQEKELDIIREHKNLCQKVPSSWFIKNKNEIKYTIISSTYTKEIIQTGLEDNIDLWK